MHDWDFQKHLFLLTQVTWIALGGGAHWSNFVFYQVRLSNTLSISHASEGFTTPLHTPAWNKSFFSFSFFATSNTLRHKAPMFLGGSFLPRPQSTRLLRISWPAWNCFYHWWTTPKVSPHTDPDLLPHLMAPTVLYLVETETGLSGLTNQPTNQCILVFTKLSVGN